MSQSRKACEILGFPLDTRMLIINVDDFGMCHSVNESGIYALKKGLASSCTVMMPCPRGFHALKSLKENPDIKFGVHLTVISEAPYYRWGPMAPSEKVASLKDEAGYFYNENRIDEFLRQVKLPEIETEFRTQIESVLSQNMRPTHLDSHCNIHVRREDIFNLTVFLAKEYGLALRVSDTSFISKIQRSGYPTPDYDVIDSYRHQFFVDRGLVGRGSSLFAQYSPLWRTSNQKPLGRINFTPYVSPVCASLFVKTLSQVNR